MLKKVAFLAVFVSLACFAPAKADEGDSPWTDAGASTGATQGNFTYKTDDVQPYIHEDQGRMVPSVYRQAQDTQKGNAANLTTSMGGPLILFGQNTGIAPVNLAYQTEHHSLVGGKLPETRLDSFVWQAAKNGNAFRIYGDEGTDGPPPLSSFDVIQSGGVRATTGHPSDAPSAWY